MSVKFVESLPEESGRGKWSGIRSELRARPGIWAEVASFNKDELVLIHRARIGVIGNHKDIKSSRRTDGETVTIYARAVKS